jgi:hypothetical protein
MHKEDHRIGITPIVMRRAAYYLSLGVGEYFPKHPHHDKVVVEKTYELIQNPTNEFEWATGMKVSFFQEGHLTRWVEFSCRTTGAGGDAILK